MRSVRFCNSVVGAFAVRTMSCSTRSDSIYKRRDKLLRNLGYPGNGKLEEGERDTPKVQGEDVVLA